MALKCTGDIFEKVEIDREKAAFPFAAFTRVIRKDRLSSLVGDDKICYRSCPIRRLSSSI